jgi:hypothetical protein
MIILQNTTDSQTFSFIARVKDYDSMYIKDESTGVETQVTIDTNEQGDYVDTISAVFTLVENRYYILTLKSGSEVRYLDKVFCTNQSIQTYSVNNDTYPANSSNNEYIVYE